MTAKEKAKQLFDQYFELVEANSSMQQEENAKKCALITVNECLHTCVESMIYYWNEVKQEIEQL